MNRRRSRRARSSRSRSIRRRRRRHWTRRYRPRRNSRRCRRRRWWRHNRSYRRRNRPWRSNRRRSNDSWSDWSWRRARRSGRLRSYRRSSSSWLGLVSRRRSRLRRNSRCGRRSSGRLLIKDGLQHVPGLGNVRQVNLGLDFVGAGMRSTTGLSRAVPVPRAFEVYANFFRFMLFERAGMRLLLGDADFCQDIENGLAFDFQFPGQIVNSNLTHPPLCSSELVPLSLHINLTEIW